MNRDAHGEIGASEHLLSERTMGLMERMRSVLLVYSMAAACPVSSLVVAIVILHVRLDLSDMVIKTVFVGVMVMTLAPFVGTGLLLLSVASDVRANAATQRRWSVRLMLPGTVCLYISFGFVVVMLPVAIFMPQALNVDVVIPILPAVFGIGFLLALAGAVGGMIEASRTAVVRYRSDHPAR